MSVNNQHELIRLRDVMDLTGWNEQYVQKLRKLKVLRVFQPNAKVRPLYYRSQVIKIQRLPAGEDPKSEGRNPKG